ncbi:unnamed protein product [Amoebophrya sp. A120]|nr:unnamed protein product [Amoebophrya sp. A120]|eukprot:GSA120T00011843001.1
MASSWDKIWLLLFVALLVTLHPHFRGPLKTRKIRKRNVSYQESKERAFGHGATTASGRNHRFSTTSATTTPHPDEVGNDKVPDSGPTLLPGEESFGMRSSSREERKEVGASSSSTEAKSSASSTGQTATPAGGSSAAPATRMETDHVNIQENKKESNTSSVPPEGAAPPAAKFPTAVSPEPVADINGAPSVLTASPSSILGSTIAQDLSSNLVKTNAAVPRVHSTPDAASTSAASSTAAPATALSSENAPTAPPAALAPASEQAAEKAHSHPAEHSVDISSATATTSSLMQTSSASDLQASILTTPPPATSTIPPPVYERALYASADGVLKEERCDNHSVGQDKQIQLSEDHDLRASQHVIGPVSFARTSVHPPVEMTVYVPGIDDNFVSSGIIRDGCWECGLVSLIVNAVTKHNQAFFLDAGANLGMYTLTVAKMGRQVFAFEPFFTTRIRLCKSVQRNNLMRNVHLFRKGLSKTPNMKFEFRGITNKNPGGVSINEAKARSSFRAQDEGVTWAESIRLDDYGDVFSHYEIPERSDMVMKMDIEGHECQAVEGMLKTIQRFSLKFVLMEWGQMYGDAAKMALHHLDRFCPSIKQLVDAFLQKGLVPSTISGHRLNPQVPTRWDGVGDVVWEPGAPYVPPPQIPRTEFRPRPQAVPFGQNTNRHSSPDSYARYRHRTNIFAGLDHRHPSNRPLSMRGGRRRLLVEEDGVSPSSEAVLDAMRQHAPGTTFVWEAGGPSDV